MTAKIITIANQKGGVGKSTLSMNLAGSLSRKNKKVIVVDADHQSTATRWASSVSDDKSFPATVIGLSAAGSKLHREVKKFIEDYDYIIIDCPPAMDSPIPQSAMLISDLCIVPLLPSPVDLWSSVGIRKIIENVSDINEDLKARLLVNQLQPRTKISKEILNILPEFGIEKLNTNIQQRTVYRQCAVFGKTVYDLGSKAMQAINEIESLTDEILEILHPSKRIRGAKNDSK